MKKIKKLAAAMWAGLRMGVAAASMVLKGTDRNWPVRAEFCAGLTLVQNDPCAVLFVDVAGEHIVLCPKGGIAIEGTMVGRPIVVPSEFGGDFAGMTPEEADGFRAMNDRINAKLLETQRVADANPLRKK